MTPTRTLRVTLPMLAAATLVPASATAATPKAVRDAEQGVVVVRAGKDLVGGAVRVGADQYVTASTLVARTSELTANFEEQPPSRARKVGLTNLPLGLTLLTLPAGAPTAIPVAEGAPMPSAGTRVWVIGPMGGTSGSRRVIARGATVRAAAGEPRGLRRLSLAASPGFKGSAVVDARGRLLGIAVPSPEGLGTSDARSSVYLLQLRERPQVATAVAAPERSQFPAVPVTIGLGVMLLLGQLVLAWRGRTEDVPAVAAAPASPSPQPAVSAAAAEPEDEITITLRP